MVNAFSFAGTPKIVFGPGKFDDVSGMIRRIGSTVLLVTGDSSLRALNRWDKLVRSLSENSIRHFHVVVQGEPSPDFVDVSVAAVRDKNIDVVLALGGGSVIDAGKAISAMLPQDASVLDYLEDIGKEAVHDGSKVPFIAVPTTSGTGSEATKNAVLSRVGPDGFKKSLRHDNFVPDLAVVDPQLMLSCPANVSAACGMDAFTQLLESYVSTNASPITDALAFSGLEHIKDSLVSVCTTGAGDVDARAGMAYAALLSGITLANAGLGVVHGLASPIGGHFDIPHGVVCGTLIGAATRVTVRKLMGEHGPDHIALQKYARIGTLASGVDEKDVAKACEMLVARIDEWTETLKVPRLGSYGIRESNFEKIVAGTGSKNNPVSLTSAEIEEILIERL